MHSTVGNGNEKEIRFNESRESIRGMDDLMLPFPSKMDEYRRRNEEEEPDGGGNNRRSYEVDTFLEMTAV